MIVASALDAWLLAHDAPVAAQPRVVHWIPTVAVQGSGATLGLAGTF
jgi:hypothetical protein